MTFLLRMTFLVALCTTSGLADPIPVDNVALKKAAEDFVQTPFVKALKTLEDNLSSPQEALSKMLESDIVVAIEGLVPKSFPQVDQFLATPVVISFKALVEKDGASKKNLDTFLQTPFIKAVDSIRANINSGQGLKDAVKELIGSPFVEALEDLRPLQVQANDKVVPAVKLLQTDFVRKIEDLKYNA